MQKKKLKIFKYGVTLSITFVLTFIASFSILYAATVQPIDIEKHWAKSAILTANSNGWAYLEGKLFKPNKPATREEVMWMLVGALKTIQTDKFSIDTKDDLSKFKDKPSPWAEGRLSIAVGNKLIGGYPDGTIRPKSSITRAELAVIISRLIDDPVPAVFSPFWDYIPQWALPAVKKAHAKGIIGGYPDSSFGTTRNVTKAETLVMIQRLIKLEQDKAFTKPPAKLPIPEEIKNVAKRLGENAILSNDNVPTIIYYSDGKKNHDLDFGDFVLIKNRLGGYGLSIINYTDENTLNSIQTMLKEFYPNEYEKASNTIKNVIDNKITEKKTYTFDGKKFAAVCEFLSIEVNIEK